MGGSICRKEKVVQQLVIAVIHRGGRNTTPELNAVIRAVGPAQAIGVLMLIGRYMSHALIVNTLDLAPPALVSGFRKPGPDHARP